MQGKGCTLQYRTHALSPVVFYFLQIPVLSPTKAFQHPAAAPHIPTVLPGQGVAPQGFAYPLWRGFGSSNNIVTKTVTGFFDFTTTLGDTVMIFTPKTIGG